MTKRSTAVVSISLPPETLSQINKLSKIERKTKTALLKEAWSLYRSWKLKKEITVLRSLGEQTRKKFKLKSEEDLYCYLEEN